MIKYGEAYPLPSQNEKNKKPVGRANGARGFMPSTFIITSFHPKDCSPYLMNVLIISPFHLIYFPYIWSRTFSQALFIVLCHCSCISLCRCSCRLVSIVHMHLIHFPLTFLIFSSHHPIQYFTSSVLFTSLPHLSLLNLFYIYNMTNCSPHLSRFFNCSIIYISVRGFTSFVFHLLLPMLSL